MERKALEWLEKQPVPVIHSSGYAARAAPAVYVPPNDHKESTNEEKYIEVMPSQRKRQPRRFPVAVPYATTMAIAWTTIPEPNLFTALDAMARDVGYIGHSVSLVRCRFLTHNVQACNIPPIPAHRFIYEGRLKELEESYHANPNRPIISPGATIPFSEPSEVLRPPYEWLILESVGGVVPNLRASALVSRLLRQTLMSGYRRAGFENSIPEIVSGHDLDGNPTRIPHLAIVPMAFAGVPYADGQVFGFALVPPPPTTLHDIPEFQVAFEAVAPYDHNAERRVLVIEGSPLRERLQLSPVDAAQKHSLSPKPYMQPSRIWASATPIVLDRHLKQHNDIEIRGLIAESCKNSGLPNPPDLNHIQIGKHSAVKGIPPAYPLTGAPPWTAWKLPKFLASRRLVHAVIDFEQEVSGPVLLGAGRFIGLGLCRGLKDWQ